MCQVLSRSWWWALGDLVGRGKTLKEYCDTSVRKVLRIRTNKVMPRCKRVNMGEDGVYRRRDGVRVQTNEGRKAVQEAKEFLKA